MAVHNKSHQAAILAEKYQACLFLAEYSALTGIVEESELDSGNTYCPRYWDGYYCWEPTLANTTRVIPCPPYVDNFHISEFARRTCLENGTWFQRLGINGTMQLYADYSACKGQPDMASEEPNILVQAFPHIQLMSICGYSISMIFLVAAIITLLSNKRLYCPRNTLHINLFLSFILRAISALMISSPGTDDNTYRAALDYFVENSVGCRALRVFFNYAIMANYFWIFVEGFYLNAMVTFSVFSDHSKIWMYILSGWLPPVGFTGAWAIARYMLYDEKCWAQNSEWPKLFWILRGPATALIICNMIFFLNIVVIIFIQFRNQTSLRENQAATLKYRKFAKATLVLLLVFGIHFFILLIIHQFSHNNVYVELIWLYVDSFFTSFQGLLTSILFCFANADVRNEINRYIFRHRTALNNLRRTSSYVSRQSYQSSRMAKISESKDPYSTSRQISRENSLHMKSFANSKNGMARTTTTLNPPKGPTKLHSTESLYIQTTDNSLENSDDEIEIEITRKKISFNPNGKSVV